jgi:uncharacterized protein YciI
VSQYIYFVKPTREGFAPQTATPQELAHIGAHWEYLLGHFKAGRVVFVGRTQEPPYTGLCVFEAADAEAARRLFEADPAVANGVFEGHNQSFQTALIQGQSAP